MPTTGSSGRGCVLPLNRAVRRTTQQQINAFFKHMKTLERVRNRLSLGEFEFSRHALKRVVERNISEQEIIQAGAQADIIEDYPDDKYSPSCLLLGFTQTGRPLHIQISLADIELVKIITIYEPDASEWVNYSQRR